ncbi:hypothetical protein NJBCHELONAE_43090 [Mycobacteroides chelonae]|uniref:hypothetical protein n=1 Tax=Mycobacteroides chelonae TaxID=1774 RepID=UPI0021DDA6C2|nr:hypothetical protein [Mycobacteroides chelonae]GLE58998.1 hypothetical protein NJBCHELONAE_43090 [Mycobacteroides chelonae]
MAMMSDEPRRIEYLCRNAQGDILIYITSQGSAENTWRMYVGGLGTQLHEIDVFDVARMRDGGTTFIFTTEGTFFAPVVPPRFRDAEDGQYWWPTRDTIENVCGWPAPENFATAEPIPAEQPFRRVDPADYDITDSTPEAGVIIREHTAPSARS